MIEEKSDLKTVDEKVRHKLEAISIALDKEKDWRKDVNTTLKIYRSMTTSASEKKACFNILWPNTEIKRQALYASPPIPDIRRRFGDDDPVGKEVSNILERAISYTIDCQDLDGELIYLVNDILLSGRGNIRIRYKPYDMAVEGSESERELEYEEAVPEHLEWDKFIQGPGKKFSDVPWIAFPHELTKDETKKRFPESYEDLTYTIEKKSEGETDEDVADIWKKTTVYEFWDKEERKVFWLGKGYTDEYLDEVDDPLDLKDFWPIPAPLYAIEDPDSMIPIIEYYQYITLAQELETVVKRRKDLIAMCKVRGAYDGTISELDGMFDSEEGGFVSLENAAAWLEKGGIEKAIWFMPIDEIASVYQILGQQRQELISQIYELTGISDIVRGDTNPNETLGAQEIKANFASARFEKQKTAVEKYIRDLIRIIAEIVSSFERKTLSTMTGLNYPSEQQQQQAQQAIQQLQQMMSPPQIPGMPQMAPPPNEQQMQQMQQKMQELQGVIQQVNWEQIEEVMQSDLAREYKIDIETDSTIAVNQQKEQANMTSMMNGLGQFIGFAGDGVATGLLTQEAAKKILVQFARKFKLGDDVEDELEKENPPAPDPEQQKIEQEMQADKQTQEFEAQKQQMEIQIKQQEGQIAQQEAQMETQKQQMELAIAKQEFALDQQKAQLEAQSMMNKDKYEEKKHQRDMQKLEESENGNE